VKYPPDASREMRETLRQMWLILDRLTKNDLDMHGRKIINLGEAEDIGDLITLGQVESLIEDAKEQIWPVGATFISTVATNPATLIGFGTWTQFATGRVLVAIDASQTEFDVVLETGGAKTHVLVPSEVP
jgi:hypothetical protein